MNPGVLGWSNASFFRDLLDPERNQALRTPERMFKLACLADVLDYPDYALELLVRLTMAHPEQYNCADLIVDCLHQIPDLTKQGLGNLPIVRKILPLCKRYQAAPAGA